MPDWAVVSEPLPVPEDARGLLFLRYRGYRVSPRQDRPAEPHRLSCAPAAQQRARPRGISRWYGIRQPDRRWSTSWLSIATGRSATCSPQRSSKIVRREDRLEQSMLDGMLTATLRVPDLRVGDELEIAYTLPGSDPTLGADSSGMLALSSDPVAGPVRAAPELGRGPETQCPGSAGPRAVRHERVPIPSRSIPISPARSPPPRTLRRVMASSGSRNCSDFADWEAVFAPVRSALRCSQQAGGRLTDPRRGETHRRRASGRRRPRGRRAQIGAAGGALHLCRGRGR